MTYGIDSVVGPVRAAELVNEYKRRLIENDCLPDRAALGMACTAYAFAHVYVLTAAGQVWESRTRPEVGTRDRVTITGTVHDAAAGHCATVESQSGIRSVLPLDQLDKEYYLHSWPEKTGAHQQE
ncbi:hypothetical protein ACIQWN_38435 [Streptomyces vinaceus]|uniref:hypothetical protein n=1 Tax=Streptomyces vinaceus TaxID=1960 RepID=UPI003802EEB2